jgi:hypothetical protein
MPEKCAYYEYGKIFCAVAGFCGLKFGSMSRHRSRSSCTVAFGASNAQTWRDVVDDDSVEMVCASSEVQS